MPSTTRPFSEYTSWKFLLWRIWALIQVCCLREAKAQARDRVHLAGRGRAGVCAGVCAGGRRCVRRSTAGTGAEMGSSISRRGLLFLHNNTARLAAWITRCVSTAAAVTGRRKAGWR